MSDWFDIRIKTDVAQFDAVRSKIKAFPDQAYRAVWKPELRRIAAEGVGVGRQVIRTDTTPTGEERRASGTGSAGRIDTGTMLNDFTARVRPTLNGETMFVGWREGTPGYAIFQELGFQHKGGAVVKGMNAVGISYEYMLSEIRKLAHGTFSGGPVGFNFNEEAV